GGTIFLDEISETSLSMQVKLLRVLQNKEVCMIGSRKSQKVNVRIIAATNKDLSILIKKNLFREDLFFRLNVININIPPLRDRDNDIISLVHHFAEKFAREHETTVPTFSDNALKVLKKYYWPGNVRELENVIQRIIVMSEHSIIDVPDLPDLMHFYALRGKRLNRTLEEVEIEYIKDVLNSQNGNKTKTAEILNIDRKTLREKIKKFNLKEL
ncbi:sigma-54-dependent Fis family transcriptional regulator, partial [Candidatus Dependentiae bacterium]|nr:sigma-54-dependent Fis family transcriptional regulator [Candidatus Dependentiae bacterium]